MVAHACLVAAVLCACATPVTRAVPPHWIGTWISASCGQRSYPRVLTLTADGQASGQDRVSPCPEGARCIWSGIVPFSGVWQGHAESITLDLQAAAGRKSFIKALPSRMTWSDGQPQATEGDQTCRYQRNAASDRPQGEQAKRSEPVREAPPD